VVIAGRFRRSSTRIARRIINVDCSLAYPWTHRGLHRQQNSEQDRRGLILDIVLGIVGAFVGGFLATRLFGESDVSGLNLYSVVVPIIGAIIVPLVCHLIFRRRAILGSCALSRRR
jgi:uncharacterized membrane protein YeaQ/YmgE (transglycosylase-associated protein family)